MKRFIKSKAIRRIVCIILCLAVLTAVFSVCVNAYMISFSKKYIVSFDALPLESYDCIMILGAGLWSGEPSPMLRERLDFGLKALDTGCSERLLMSGDHGTKSYDEVNTMKDYAAERGVEPDFIFMDHAGFSTYESMYRARDIFKVERVLIVTQKYHLYRAVYDARKLGIDSYGFAAEELLFPFTNDVREAVARVKDFLWCIVKPEPTYLGDAVPIMSSLGSQTDDRK